MKPKRFVKCAIAIIFSLAAITAFPDMAWRPDYSYVGNRHLSFRPGLHPLRFDLWVHEKIAQFLHDDPNGSFDYYLVFIAFAVVFLTCAVVAVKKQRKRIGATFLTLTALLVFMIYMQATGRSWYFKCKCPDGSLPVMTGESYPQYLKRAKEEYAYSREPPARRRDEDECIAVPVPWPGARFSAADKRVEEASESYSQEVDRNQSTDCKPNQPTPFGRMGQVPELDVEQ